MPAGDPFYSSVSALLHFDGADGSISIVDNAPSPRTFSVLGNARISTAQSRFGGSSLLLDGSGDYLETPNSPVFNFGTGDYTIEFWSYRTSTKADCIVAHNTTDASATGGWWVNFAADTFQVYCAGSLVVSVAGAGTAGSSWKFWRLVRASGTVYVFRDGALIGSAASSHAMNSASSLQIGGSSRFGGFDGWFNGHIDDLRITNGVARSTANFTPPSEAFEDSPPPLILSGVVTGSAGTSVARVVRAHREDTGAYVGGAISDATTGAFSINTAYVGEHTLVAYPVTGEATLPALVHRGVIPI